MNYMMLSNEIQISTPKNHDDDDTKDPTAPFYELESFDSIWQALRWKEIRTRVPVCFRKTIRSRYMLANLVYLGYAIGILIIDFNPVVNGSSASSSTDGAAVTETTESMITTTPMPVLDEPVFSVPLVNHLYIGFAVIHLLSAFLYWWAWHGRSWLDVIMIPEYLNHIEAGLYIWSATWYSREDTLGGYYTLAIHKIEMTAATIELVASFGWIMSWYMTYIRTLGRGFCLDDPDTIAYLTTTIASIIYFVYNIQINVQPEQYDDHWLWFLPLAGQYGVAPGRIQIETTKNLPYDGKPSILMTDLCRRRRTENHKVKVEQDKSDANNPIITIFL